MAATKRRGRPRKDTQAVLADYRGERGRVYAAWKVSYDGLRLNAGLSDKAARGDATRRAARRFNLTPRRIQQIVDQGRALERTITTRAHASASKLDAALREFREMSSVVEEAAVLLRKPAYKDLLDGCAMNVAKLPKALREFSSAPEAIAPDSLQHLAAMLARAFLRCHDFAERSSSAYSERKIAPRR